MLGYSKDRYRDPNEKKKLTNTFLTMTEKIENDPKSLLRHNRNALRNTLQEFAEN